MFPFRVFLCMWRDKLHVSLPCLSLHVERQAAYFPSVSFSACGETLGLPVQSCFPSVPFPACGGTSCMFPFRVFLCMWRDKLHVSLPCLSLHVERRAACGETGCCCCRRARWRSGQPGRQRRRSGRSRRSCGGRRGRGALRGACSRALRAPRCGAPAWSRRTST